MNYTKPNPKAEWPEALRYRIFERMGFEAWVKLIKKGKSCNFSQIDELTGNVDLDYDSLDEDKKARFEKAYKSGEVEMPVVVRFKKYKFDLVGGNTRLAGLVMKGHNPKVWVIDISDDESKSSPINEKTNPHDSDDDKDDIFPTGSSDWRKKKDNKEQWEREEDPLDDNLEEPDDDDDYRKPKRKPKPKAKPKPKKDVKETDSSSAGGYEAPFGGKPAVIKRPVSKIPNFMNEATDSSVSASAAFDVPFGGGGTKGRKNPLKIDGPNSIYKSRAVKDKKFPRFGGPDAVFVKIKEHCKKYPYCNQGDQNNLQFLHEDEDFKDAITKAAEMYGIPYSDVEKIVINEIKKIFI
jgi:hypothetical protein